MPNGVLGRIGDYARQAYDWQHQLAQRTAPYINRLARGPLGMIGPGESIELLDEAPTMVNASGESEASLEAIRRGASEAKQGIKRFAVDSRSGAKRPVFGVDTTPNPYEHIVRSGPEGDFIETSGSKARPFMSR